MTDIIMTFLQNHGLALIGGVALGGACGFFIPRQVVKPKERGTRS